VIALPNATKVFFIDCDASSSDVVLMQDHYPLAYPPHAQSTAIFILISFY